jgi:hypothetical protein
MQEIENPEGAAQQGTAQGVAPAGSSIDRSRPMLTYLAEHEGPQPVADLLQVSGLTLTEFYGAITTLQEVGLIELSGDAGQEQAALTIAGRYVTQM